MLYDRCLILGIFNQFSFTAMSRPALGPHNFRICIFRLLFRLTREADLLPLSRTEVKIVKTFSLPLRKPSLRGTGKVYS